MADGGYNTNNTNNSTQFSDAIRAGVKKTGVSRITRARSLRYLAGIKHGQEVEMPPKKAPEFQLRNFAGNALAELEAANARPLTQRNAKRAALLQKARNKGKNPAYAGIPYELNSNKSKTRRNGPNETPPSGTFKVTPAENLTIKQNGMSGNNNLNEVLNGLPLKGAAKPPGNAVLPPGNAVLPPASPVLPPAKANNKPKTVLGPTSPVGANYSGYVEPSEFLASGAGYNYSKGRESANNFEPSSNALLPGYGTGGRASNINTGGIALSTNLQGPLALAPSEANFANAGTNTQANAAARVQAERNETAGTNNPLYKTGASLGDLNDADLIVDVVFSDVNSIPRGGKIGVNLTKKDGSKFLGLPSMSLGMPGMPGMPKFSMPRFSGPKIDLSWLKLPSFPHFKLPETDILGMLGKFLAALPVPTREQIIAALKQGGKYIGLALISPLLLAAWLYDHGFNLNIKLDGLTGGLISLEDFFLGGNQPAVKEIGRKLKMATDIAKRVVTNTIAEQELLQRQVNQKTRTEESVKQQILASLDSQIANIKTTLANLSADIKQVTVDPEYDSLIDDIDFTGYKAKATNSANTVLMAELNMLLDSIQKAYEGMAQGEEATVAQKNVEKFKQIRKNFDDMINLPKKIRDEIAKTAAPGVGAKLKELGRDARSRTAKLGYNIAQGFKTARQTIGGLFGTGQKITNKNKNKIAAAAMGANGQPKKTWRNKLGNYWTKTKKFFTRSKNGNGNGNGKTPFTAPGPSALPGANNVPVVNNPIYTPESLASKPAGLSSNRVKGFNNFRGAGAASRKQGRGGLRIPPAASAAARSRKLRR